MMNWIKKSFQLLKPWVSAVVVVIILQITGLLSGLSFLAQSAMLKTGLADASVEEAKDLGDFNYDFKIKDLEGNRIDFSEFKNKVVFLNLWATWCGPCRAEMPTIQKLYEKAKDDESIKFVILSLDKDADKGKVIKYLKDKGFTFDGYMPSGYLTTQLNVPNIPTTYVVSKEGKILTKEVGTTNFNTTKFFKFLKAEASR